MDFDPVILARLQFAFTVSFHIIFPSFTIGLAAWIATLEGVWLWTGNARYHNLAHFWTKIFAVSFGMGVVSGIVLSYQFGTNWSQYAHVVGNVVAPLIGYEVLTAFFLEATFLGIMLFGWNRVPPWLHFVACLLVAIGTSLSAFWILSANSWMQFPAGHEMRNGIAVPVDWLKVIFNPTFPLRLAHMLIAAYITTALVVLAVGARYWVAGRAIDQAETMMKMALGLLIILVPLQAFIGDAHGRKTAEYQPVKLAAIEGHWDEANGPADLVLFAWPDAKEEKSLWQIGIPHLGSLIITHKWDGTYPGLKQFPKDDWPPLWGPFFGFRIMVGLWGLMALTALVGGVKWVSGRLFSNDIYLQAIRFVWPLGFLTVLAGWFTTEIGRQPWVATGLLRTDDAASPVHADVVLTTLVLFVLVYGTVFTFGVRYIFRLLAKGPEAAILGERVDAVPSRPISAAFPADRP